VGVWHFERLAQAVGSLAEGAKLARALIEERRGRGA
jgi:hypothetical protein